MSAAPPPPPSASAYFCGRCGAAVSGAGFCGRCGNPTSPVPPASNGYSYPVVPSTTVPAMRHKLGARKLWLVAGAVITVLTVLVTVIAVAVRPLSHPCGYYCGPNVGPPLVGQTLYSSRQFNVSIEYPTSSLHVGSQSDAAVSFNPVGPDGSPAFGGIDFAISSGANVDGAIANAVATLPTANIQNLQEIGPVRGAEIGLVLGNGTAYSATYVPNNGGPSMPVGVVVIGASSANVTMTATMFSAVSQDPTVAPYGLSLSPIFDYPVTNARFPGG